MERKFELINHVGGFFEAVEATSFRTARKQFVKRYFGDFLILEVETGIRRRVKL